MEYNIDYLVDADEYYESLTKREQRKMDHLVYRMATKGVIRNKEKFRIVHKKEKIYEFKPQPHRFFCFFVVGKRIYITNGYCKQTNKVDPRELKKAISLKHQFLAEEKTRSMVFWDPTTAPAQMSL